MKRFTAFATLVVFAAGCASTTIIKSKPEGAKVKIDGVDVGETPYTLTDTAPAWQSHKVTVAKSGYKEQTVEVKHSELNVIRLIAGLFLCVPLVWVTDYP